MKQNKVFSLLGLAEKSRNIVSGEFMTEKTIKSGKAELVIVGEDASDNTKKMFTNMCNYRDIPIYFYGTKEELGHAIGKEMRASLTITSAGFADSIKKHLEISEI